MRESLIWVCLASVLLTAITLWEAIRDLRAVRRRNSSQNLFDAACHSVIVETARLCKVILLAFGSYVSSHCNEPSSIVVITIVSAFMGLTSLAELIFRHRMMKRLWKQYEESHKAKV